jgi:hydroxymethylpyrimidine pyrophosphatase-like HAD family hydrolase
MKKFILAVDVDGTIIKNENDYVPRTLMPNVKEVLDWAHKKNCFIILWTCRSGAGLQQAVNFLKQKEIPFDAVNENYPNLGIETSNKIFASYYIDDRSFEINWLEIKKVIAKKIIEQLVDEIIELSKDLKET